MRIAVVLQHDTEHGRGILRGIARCFRRRPDVQVWKFGRDVLGSPLALRQLQADGMIARVATAEEERAVRSLRVPVINVSGSRLTRLPTVNTDDAMVGRLAARDLLSRGYRHLAFCGSREHLASRRRLAGFSREAEERGVEAPRSWEPADAARELRSLRTPAAVFAFTDPAAITVAQSCQAAGLRVPEDVAVLGVGNDLTRLEFSHIDVSSVELNTARIGETAAEQLWDWIRHGRRPPRETLLAPVRIVTRRSTDLFAVDDEAVAQALQHIRAHAGNALYVEDVARAAGVSRRILEMRFRRALGTTVYSEVQRLHFERALELMAAGALTVSEIAYASGFDSAQRFSTAFRRRYGVPPSRYLKQVGLSR